jgi:Ca2+-binding EF-hand superfamily protein
MPRRGRAAAVALGLGLALASPMPAPAPASPPADGPSAAKAGAAGTTAAPASSASGRDRDGAQDVIFLGDGRPVFIRLRLDTGGRGFRAAWLDAVKAVYADLDRDGDGVLTDKEADRGGLPTMVRAATGGAAALPRADLDANPRDGKVSLDELADVLRPALGPFRVQINRLSVEKADALFNHLDRDKDGALSRDELASAVASLRRFDLDDDELLDPGELEPFDNPMASQFEDDQTRRGRFTAVPPVIELSPDDPSIRPVRMILRRYDRGSADGSPAGDNRLARDEFAIDPRDFDAADTDSDGALDTEELRRFLARTGPDLEMTVKLPDDGKTPASIDVGGAVAGARPLPMPAGVKVQRLSPADVEVAVGEVSLEFHADAGERGADEARRYYAGQFRAADKDNNQYLEKSEVKAHGPFAALFDMIDRDGDGKLYMKEVDGFVDRQARAARGQVVLSAADQGRAIFAIMDLNRDRKLGAREVRGTVARVSSWDRDADGKVGSDEIPHRFQLTVGRGQVTGVGMAAAGGHGWVPPADPPAPAAGPSWFRRMDRNKDGDVSRREFLGPRAQFDRLDRDGDGLIDAQEAAAAKP